MRTGNPKKSTLFIQFIVMFVALSGAAFFALALLVNTYRADTLVIVVPKNEKSATDAEHIIGNLETLPTTVSFYEKMINDSGRKDLFPGFSEKKKEAAWNNIIAARRKGNSSIVQISVYAPSAHEAASLSKDIIPAVLGTMSYYYDIKNEVDIRIIEGPFVSNTLSSYWPAEIAASVILGLLFSFFIDRILSLFSRRRFVQQKPTIAPGKPSVGIPQEEPVYEIKKKEPPAALFSAPHAPEKKAPIAPRLEKKSSAPENLPFIDEDYFRSTIVKSAAIKKEARPKESFPEPQKTEVPLGPSFTSASEPKKEEIDHDIHREPTKEELKKRLNQLLRGEL